MLAIKNKSRLPGLFKKVDLEEEIIIDKKQIYRPRKNQTQLAGPDALQIE